jgi:hypothetical protein
MTYTATHSATEAPMQRTWFSAVGRALAITFAVVAVLWIALQSSQAPVASSESISAKPQATPAMSFPEGSFRDYESAEPIHYMGEPSVS